MQVIESSTLGPDKEIKDKVHECAEYMAIPVVVHTKLQDQDLSPPNIVQTKKALLQYFSFSSFMRRKCGSKATDLSSMTQINAKDTAFLDLFVIPYKNKVTLPELSVKAKSPHYGNYGIRSVSIHLFSPAAILPGLASFFFCLLRNPVLSLNCPSFMGNVSERDWLKSSAKMWELVKSSPISRTLISSGAYSSGMGIQNQGSSMDHNDWSRQQATFIPDNFSSLDQVISALREAGLESSNLILGIDFTKSNEWTGKYSFNRRSLHAIGSSPNPYEQAISIIGRTLSPFDEDNLIPCFGFGDGYFYPDHQPCHGFEEALARYREIVPRLNLAGPTSFAPIIDAAIDIVDKSSQYHVLVIIADGQVTRTPNTPRGRLSPQEQATIDSIVAASHYPLSIILVGVGDGPWDSMKQFDDNIPHRGFDNFQFVNFTKIMSENTETSKKEAGFALAALMEIPYQYRACLNIRFDNRELDGGHLRPLPPPREVTDHDNAVKSIPNMTNYETAQPTPAQPVISSPAEPVCPICLTNPKDMAFGCGHTV
ncbi:hypothetical protein CRYUN_Cryun24cG0071800 [Craigia yunnanensis]